jgi:predicted acetyltransferase
MIKENIDNLTSLWKTAGNSVGTYFENSEFNGSIIEDSEWPNRIWFNTDANIKILTNAVKFVYNNSKTLTVPYWNNYNNGIEDIFELFNLKLKFKQVGMSMKLENNFEYEERLLIKKVENEKEAQTWENIYPQAFGYKISKETLLATHKKINYYLAFLNEDPIGTAIVYNSNNISGIHGVGVIPSARRKGFAEEIMKYVINKSIDDKMEYSTLQASDMGKGIYLRLGYSEDFTINNFVLNE